MLWKWNERWNLFRIAFRYVFAKIFLMRDSKSSHCKICIANKTTFWNSQFSQKRNANILLFALRKIVFFWEIFSFFEASKFRKCKMQENCNFAIYNTKISKCEIQKFCNAKYENFAMQNTNILQFKILTKILQFKIPAKILQCKRRIF